MWNVSSAFKNALRQPVRTYRTKAEVLDTNFRVVPGGTFVQRTDATQKGDIRDYIIDGVVDVDISRPARRTFTMTLINQDGQFSPGSNWGGMFYVNRLIRISRGVDVNGTTEWVPVGTFMIDNADVLVERNMSLVVLTGQDLWKKLSKTEMNRTRTWSKGTDVVDIIKNLAEYCGVTRIRAATFNDRELNEKEIGEKLTMEAGDKVSDFVFKLAADFGIEVYFDPMGYLTVEEIVAPSDSSLAWTYRPGNDSMLVSLRASYKDDKLYNEVLAIGHGDKKQVYIARVSDTDPSSPTNVNRIGRRTFRYESSNIKSTAQARRAARKQFNKHFTLQEDISLETILIPGFEGNDVIKVEEPDFVKVSRRYRIRSFSIPLSGSRQSVKLQRMVDIS